MQNDEEVSVEWPKCAVCDKPLTRTELALAMYLHDMNVECEECMRQCEDDHISVDNEA